MTPQYQDWYNQRVADLQGLYAPQIAGIQQQIEQLPGQYEAQKSSLQQAKENAFRDITKTAARGGMFFTGFTPREQARYLGEKYLPGLQQLSQQETAARQGLLNQITGLQGQQRAAGLTYLDTLRGYQRADELAAKQLAATRAGAFDADALRRLLEPDGDTTPTEELDPYYDYARTSIENAKSLGRLADNKIKTLINIQKQFVLGIGAKRNATEEAKKIARGRLNAFKAILGEAKYNSLGGI
jgi:uncharacterized protein YbjQ (UPF0145 family)